jgi:hypothetical protein
MARSGGTTERPFPTDPSLRSGSFAFTHHLVGEGLRSAGRLLRKPIYGLLTALVTISLVVGFAMAALGAKAIVDAGAADDIQRYNGMASGSLIFNDDTPAMMVLDFPPTGKAWLVRNVVIGIEDLSTDIETYSRFACWFQDADSTQHAFASFRVHTTPDAGSEWHEADGQRPVWFDAAASGQVWCGGSVVGANLTGGIGWLRMDYKAVTP